MAQDAPLGWEDDDLAELMGVVLPEDGQEPGQDPAVSDSASEGGLPSGEATEPEAAEEATAGRSGALSKEPLVEEPEASEPMAIEEEPLAAEPEASEPKANEQEPLVEEPEASEPMAIEEEPLSAEPEASEPKAIEEEPLAAEPEASEPKAIEEEPLAAEPEASEPKAIEQEPLVKEPEAREPMAIEEELATLVSTERALRAELEETKGKLEESLQERATVSAEILAIRQKAKEHLKQMQEKMQLVIKQKDQKTADLQREADELREELERSRSERTGSSAEADSLSAECESLRNHLKRSEAMSKERRDEVALLQQQLLEANQGLEQQQHRLQDAKGIEEALRSQLQEREATFSELQLELGQVKQERENTVGDIVRKAKDRLQQVQTRLEASLTENKELSEKNKEMDKAYQQQQDKVVRFKSLMAQANTRIADSDEAVAGLRSELNSITAERDALQTKFANMSKERELYSTPPSQEEIAARGGVLYAVESGEDIWCFIADSSEGQDEEGRPGHWWRFTDLEMEGRPVPMQRKWKGEGSALRAQIMRFKKMCDAKQEEFDTYKQKAGTALSMGAGDDLREKDRKVEQLGEQLQTHVLELARAQADKARAADDLCEVRKRLQEQLAHRVETERIMELRAKEREESHENALEQLRRSFEVDKLEAETRSREKERGYQQELHMRHVEKEGLVEEVQGLRSRLSHMIAASCEEEVGGDLQVVEPPKAPRQESRISAELRARVNAIASTGDSHESDAQAAPAAPAEPAAPLPAPEAPAAPAPHAPADAGSSLNQALCESLSTHYSPQFSVALQDVTRLRGQVRQLEVSLEEERRQHSDVREQSDSLKSELREMTLQHQLQAVVGQRQQMEYIRNIFRKFVESMPVGSTQQEQLVTVLLTFFQFPGEEVKQVEARRGQLRRGWWG